MMDTALKVPREESGRKVLSSHRISKMVQVLNESEKEGTEEQEAHGESIQHLQTERQLDEQE